MVATIPMNRIGAHFDTVPAGLPELPQSARGRGQHWSDAAHPPPPPRPQNSRDDNPTGDWHSPLGKMIGTGGLS